MHRRATATVAWVKFEELQLQAFERGCNELAIIIRP